MTLEDGFGLLFMGYFALMISLGIGVFAWGATGAAVLLVLAFSIPLLALLSLAIAATAEHARRAA